MNKMNGGKRGCGFGRAVAILGSLLGVAGCGSADVQSETIGETSEAITISNWNDLVAMGTTGNYTLGASINANGKTWTPKSFSGTFDGGGKTISNLTINVSGDAGFFSTLTNATVKNVKFTNLNVTGTWFAGGLAAVVTDSTLERIVVEGTISANNGWAAGGIAAYMLGGTLTRSYAKGTVTGSPYYAAGGLVAGLFWGSDRGEIWESYAQATVSPSTSDPTRLVAAGGIVGRTFAGHIHDVYYVGNVTGRGGVGGLVGYLDGDAEHEWFLYKGVSRGGDVVDKNKTGGWEGTVGTVVEHTGRFTMLHFDAEADGSSGPGTTYSTYAQRGHTTNELKLPTTPIGGVFCEPDVIPERCGDNAFFDPPWNAGNSSQHHILRNMPGPNTQPQ